MSGSCADTETIAARLWTAGARAAIWSNRQGGILSIVGHKVWKKSLEVLLKIQQCMIDVPMIDLEDIEV